MDPHGVLAIVIETPIRVQGSGFWGFRWWFSTEAYVVWRCHGSYGATEEIEVYIEVVVGDLQQFCASSFHSALLINPSIALFFEYLVELRCHASEGVMEETEMYIEFVVGKIFNNFVHQVPFLQSQKKPLNLSFVMVNFSPCWVEMPWKWWSLGRRLKLTLSLWLENFNDYVHLAYHSALGISP